jgi:hypothetical protein
MAHHLDENMTGLVIHEGEVFVSSQLLDQLADNIIWLELNFTKPSYFEAGTVLGVLECHKTVYEVCAPINGTYVPVFKPFDDKKEWDTFTKSILNHEWVYPLCVVSG